MQATHTARALTAGALIAGGLMTGQTAHAAPAPVETRALVEDFHTTTKTNAEFRKRYAKTVTLYDNTGIYNQNRIVSKADEMWIPLSAGAHDKVKGFAAKFLTDRIGYGTLSFKAQLVPASGNPNTDTGWGMVLLGWTTGNPPDGAELDLAETPSHEGKSAGSSGNVWAHHHSNLSRCEKRNGTGPVYCPDAAKASTGDSFAHWHTYKVIIEANRTRYYVDSRKIIDTDKYPTGPTVAKGYRLRPTAQASCLAVTCKAAVAKIAQVKFTPGENK